jgi:hypothetical protein
LAEAQRPGLARTGSSLLLLALVAGGGSGARCGGPAPSLTLTVNAIPDAHNDLLVLPPSGFTVDVGFVNPGLLLPTTLEVWALPWDPELPNTDLSSDLVVLDLEGGVALVSPAHALAPGSYTLLALADVKPTGNVAASLDVAVRSPPTPPPLAAHQWIQLDFAADRDGDSAPDFPEDLASFGLGSGAAPALSQVVEDWVVAEVVARSQAYYDGPNPSGLPGGDPANLTFSELPPASGPFTRICVAGEDPSGGVTIGNVLYDPGNGNPANVACDDFLPSGVFPREFLFYASSAAFQAVFAPLLAQPVGTDPLDPLVLGPAYDPGDPAQLARFTEIESGVETFAQALATICAHEAGHAIGLVPPGPPGGGLYGGSAGADFTHDVEPWGGVPAENLLMNRGSSFSFEELTGLGGVALPRLRELDFGYLQGRLVLDAAVTGIFEPPSVGAVSPSLIDLSGPSIVQITVTGQDFQATPSLRLIGPTLHYVQSETLQSPTQMTGLVFPLQLVAGTYDLELKNPDGQKDLLSGAIQVVP